MATSLRQSRSLLAASAVLAAAVALVVAVGVIPLVRVTTAPGITPDTAVPAFWVAAGLHLVAALVLGLTAALSKGRSSVSTSVLVITGIAIALLGLVLGDAALAFREAGSMQTVAALLLVCVVTDIVAGALAVVTAFRRPARPRQAASSSL